MLPIPLVVNCGFARVAIKELSMTGKGIQFNRIDKNNRSERFKNLFNIPTFGIPDDYFTHSKHDSQFNRHSERILTGFSMRWNPATGVKDYLNGFSIKTWEELSEQEKSQHTLTECKACAVIYSTLQSYFPLKPHYQCAAVEDVYEKLGSSTKDEAKAANTVLKLVNVHHQKKYGHSLTDTITKLCPEEGVMKKPTPTEKKRKRRKLLRDIRDKENEALKRTTMRAVFSENESLGSYARKRKTTCFEQSSTPKRPKSHTPNYDQATWDKQGLLSYLQVQPPCGPQQPPINWSEVARHFEIPGKNGGQIAKEYARKNGIDVYSLDNRAESTKQRASKRKLPGGEISVPCPPTVSSLKKQKILLVESGEISLGVPCSPYVLSRSTIKEGMVYQEKIQVEGRKIPLTDLRQKTLKQQEEFMKLWSDDVIESMNRDELIHTLEKAHEPLIGTESLPELQTKFKRTQRTRHLAFWHDHASILCKGYLLVTVSVLFDPLVHLSREEYKQKTGKNVENIQEMIEQPQVHLLALGGSSLEDQLAIIGDRTDCLHEMQTKLTSSEGIEVTDIVRFFVGDKPAQNFERGTQNGGNYKCGTCGIRSSLIEVQGHALRCAYRSLDDLQKLVIGGTYGKQPGVCKPFDKLKVKELRQELCARSLTDIDGLLADDLRKTLNTILKGAQRVPSLFVHDPEQNPSTLHLQNYTILSCEPLHCLKGHLLNLYAELPNILTGPLREECEKIINAHTQSDKVKCVDLRTAAIHLLLLFKQKASPSLTTLMETIVRVSGIMYATEAKRSPRTVLQLYNLMWLHHELCSDLFPTTKHISRDRLFGSYIHDLSAHAGLEYEIVCSRSVNAECQERLFAQAKRIALNTTNRHADQVIPEVLFRLQMKEREGTLSTSITANQTKVQTAAKSLTEYKGTVIQKEFIRCHKSSWQAHLERISNYLVHGPNIWWNDDGQSYIFHDGDHDPDFHPVGPKLHHFRSFTIQNALQEKQESWKKILTQNIVLPASTIAVYSPDGSFLSTKDVSGCTNGTCMTSTHTEPSVKDCTNHTAGTTSASRGHPNNGHTKEPYFSECTEPHADTNGTTCRPNRRPSSNGHTEESAVREDTNCTASGHSSNTQLIPGPSTSLSPFIECKQTSNCLDASHSNAIEYTVDTNTSAVSASPSELPTTSTSSSIHQNKTSISEPSTGYNQSTEPSKTEGIITIYTDDSVNVPSELRTTHAKAIAKALGMTDLVKRFDNLRSQAKKYKKPAATLKDEHNAVLTQLQTNVMELRTEKLSNLKKVEQNFYEIHKRLPTTQENAEYTELLKQYSYAQKLLRKMNISL